MDRQKNEIDPVYFKSTLSHLVEQRYQTVTPALLEIVEEPIDVAGNALDPISKIDFEKLVSIYDHEEAFIEREFYLGLAGAFLSRLEEGSTVQSITKSDVRFAMIAVGTAARLATEDQLAANNKALLISICPYCV